MQSFVGKVISNKMNQTVVIAVGYSYAHRKYKKIVKKTTKLFAHNTLQGIQIDDLVRVEACKPISKNKHFEVKEIVKKVLKEGKIESAEPEILTPKRVTRKRSK